MMQVRGSLRKLSLAARTDFLALWTRSDMSSDRARQTLIYWHFPELIERYGGMAASLAADVFEGEAEALGIRPSVELADGVNVERAAARFAGELNSTTTLATSLQLIDELVQQPYRSTFQDSAIASGAGWARVPIGDTCNFCIVLASRGGVYSSKDVAILGYSGKKYHGYCDCQPVLVRDESDYPAGYDPDALYDRYKAQHARFDTMRDVTAKMRAAYGGH